MPKISIIIPTYNGEKYISRAIESVLMQNFNEYEILIGDNASTDNTFKIVQKYSKKYKNIKYIRNEKNIGYPKNVYNLINYHASGEYVAILCDDDYYTDPRVLETYTKILDSDSEIILIFSKFLMIHENSSFHFFNQKYDKISYDIIKAENFFLNFSYFLNKIKFYPMLSSLCFRREYAIKNKIFEEFENSYTADYLAINKTLILNKEKKIAFVKNIFGIYFFREGNLSNKHPTEIIITQELQSVNKLATLALKNKFNSKNIKKWKSNELKRLFHGKFYLLYYRLRLAKKRISIKTYIKFFKKYNNEKNIFFLFFYKDSIFSIIYSFLILIITIYPKNVIIINKFYESFKRFINK